MMNKKSANEGNERGELIIHHYLHGEEDIIDTAHKFKKYFEELDLSKQNVYQNVSAGDSFIIDEEANIVTVHQVNDAFHNEEIFDSDLGNVNQDVGDEDEYLGNVNYEEANSHLGNVNQYVIRNNFSSRGRQIFQSTRYPQKEFLTYTKKNIKKI